MNATALRMLNEIRREIKQDAGKRRAWRYMRRFSQPKETLKWCKICKQIFIYQHKRPHMVKSQAHGVTDSMRRKLRAHWKSDKICPVCYPKYRGALQDQSLKVWTTGERKAKLCQD